MFELKIAAASDKIKHSFDWRVAHASNRQSQVEQEALTFLALVPDTYEQTYEKVFDYRYPEHMSEGTGEGKRGRGRPSKDELNAEFGDVAELREARSGAAGLTLRQRKVLQVITEHVARYGYPPSIRQVGDLTGLASPASVAYQLRALESKGFIRRDPNLPRAIELLTPDNAEPQVPAGSRAPELDSAASHNAIGDAVQVPVLGQIAAGGPILADELVEDILAVPKQLIGEGQHFMLRVKGDSMIDAAICDGDWVVVRQQPDANNGDIVAALLDNEATVKTFKRTPNQVWLLPHNPAYEPIDGNHASIMGKVVAVMRRV